MGTRIADLPVAKVLDGDTIKVELNSVVESLRLAGVDTEESQAGSKKPVTKAGQLASEMAKKYFAKGNGFVTVDLEFETDDPVEVCLEKHRDNYGRLLCYVFKGKENYNLKLVKEGWSPYFMKYGRSLLYNDQFMQLEAQAQTKNLVVWNPETNGTGNTRDYKSLVPWWGYRAAVIDEFRRIESSGKVISVRLDYAKVQKAAEKGDRITIFCDFQDGFVKFPFGAKVSAGSKFHQLDLWMPEPESEVSQDIFRLVEHRYAGTGRGYAYVTGKVEKHKEFLQIKLTDIEQISDFPPQ
jgi:micrococcal nuclease